MNIDSVTLDTHAHTDVDTEYNILARKKNREESRDESERRASWESTDWPDWRRVRFLGALQSCPATKRKRKKKGKITSCVRAHPGLSSRPIENTPHIDSRQHPPTRHRRRSVGHLLLFNKELNAIIKKKRVFEIGKYEKSNRKIVAINNSD